MLIQCGTLINSHLAKQSKYKFNAEHWGTKLLSIHWKHILKLWATRNGEVKGKTPEKMETIHQKDMINEILHLQIQSAHLPISAQELVFRDATALQTLKTSMISAHLYGLRMLITSSQQHQETPGQQSITSFFEQQNRIPSIHTDTTTDTAVMTTPKQLNPDRSGGQIQFPMQCFGINSGEYR
jgi:hypothetical protein